VLVLYVMFPKNQFVWQDFVIAEELHVAFLCSKFTFIVLIAFKIYIFFYLKYQIQVGKPVGWRSANRPQVDNYKKRLQEMVIRKEIQSTKGKISIKQANNQFHISMPLIITKFCWIILYLGKHHPPLLLLAPWGLFFLCLLNLQNFLHNLLLLHQESPDNPTRTPRIVRAGFHHLDRSIKQEPVKVTYLSLTALPDKTPP